MWPVIFDVTIQNSRTTLSSIFSKSHHFCSPIPPWWDLHYHYHHHHHHRYHRYQNTLIFSINISQMSVCLNIFTEKKKNSQQHASSIHSNVTFLSLCRERVYIFNNQLENESLLLRFGSSFFRSLKIRKF